MGSVGAEDEVMMCESKVHPGTNGNIKAGSHVHGIAFKDKTTLLKFKYFFQYPYMRMFIAYFVTICNFVIYAEDPVAHSHSKCEIPVLGNAFSMIVTKYPPNGFSALKALLWITAIVIGIGVGKLLIHKWLFNKKLRVGMFSSDQGSWMICFLFTILVVLISSAIYNLFLSLKNNMTPYVITAYIGATNSTFMRAGALGTWFGDFLTAWMVTDMMLQETGRYKRWKPQLRGWWNKGRKRVALFWCFSIILTILVVICVTTNLLNWDKFNRDLVYTNELGRAFLASFILMMDFTIIMQDWDFPMFDSDLDIKLPGVNVAHVKVEFPEWITKNMIVHITGKWFQYGVLFIVLLLDMNMWKNQIFYEPLIYGQYVGDDGHIFTVFDAFSLANYGNATIFSYDWRNRTINPATNKTFMSKDYKTNSRYRGYSLASKGMAFIPSILTFLVFGLLIHYFGKRQLPKNDETKVITLELENVDNIDNEETDGDTSPKNIATDNIDNEEADSDSNILLNRVQSEKHNEPEEVHGEESNETEPEVHDEPEPKVNEPEPEPEVNKPESCSV